MRKAIKKIIALGMGATMLGASILGASAFSLNDYPAPFVENGAFNGVLVVGDSAAAMDVVGVSDIMMSLQYAASTPVSYNNKASVTVEGDYFEFSKGNDLLDFGEQLTEVKSTLTSDDLDALKDGVFKGKNKEKYTQEIKVATDAKVVLDVYDEESEDPALYLKFSEDEPILHYKMRFSSSVISDVDEDDVLEDFIDEKINMLGKDYTITEADLLDDEDGDISLTLMSGAIQTTMIVGEEKTFEINDKEYKIKVVIISGDGRDAVVKFQIGDKTTKSMEAGDTYEIDEDVDLGVKEVLPTKSGDVVQNLVEFYLGANRIVLDNNGMEISEVSNVNDVEVTIDSSMSGGDVKLNGIEIIWAPTMDVYVKKEGTLVESMKLEDENDAVVLLEKLNIDYEFDKLVATNNDDVIELQGDGDDVVELEYINKNDETYTVPLYYAEDGNVALGENSGKRLYLEEGDVVCDEEMFVVENDETSRVLKLTQIKDDIIKVKDLGTKTTDEYDRDEDDVEMNIDSYDYTVEVVGDCIELIDITDDADSVADIYTKYGSKLELVNNSITLYESEDMYGPYTINLKADADEIDFNGTFNGVNVIEYDSNDDKSIGYTEFGTKFERDSSVDIDEWTITIPEEQMEARVFFTSGETTIVSTDGSSGDAVVLEKIDIGATKLASEIAGKELEGNILLVGGPCANAAVVKASDEFPSCSQASWKLGAGEAYIHMVERADGNMALLVAGTTAADTRAATKIVADMKELKTLPDGTMKQKLITATGLLVSIDAPEVVVEADGNETNSTQV